MKIFEDYFYEDTNSEKMPPMNQSTTAAAATKTTTTSSTTTKAISTTTMSSPSIGHLNNEQIIEIIENLTDIKIWIIIITIIIIKIVIIKAIKLCKKGYEIHNQKVIQRHNRDGPRI